jgi:putative ABC transport system permease protein
VIEFGARKALGTSTFDIVRLLIRQFAKPLRRTNLIAWRLMARRLDGLACRIELSPGPFVFAARARPIAALCYE